jgi:hypothetical protein
MNITAHPVAPEEVMAFLDGELSAAEAQAVSTHVEHCADCAKLTEQFRSVSQSLARWNVEAVPVKLEKTIADSIGKAGSSLDLGKPNFFIRSSFWSWNQWAVAGGGAVAALLLLIAISMPNLHRSRTVAEFAYYDNKPADKANSGASQIGHLYAGKPITEQQSKVFPSRIGVELVASAPPPAIAVPNGTPHGREGHADNSPSVINGQPMADQLSTNAPMIARTVSLSIVAKDFAASRSLLDSVLARHHGYFGRLNISTPENAARNLQASLRIPASELPAALADLKKLGRVETESQSGEEVTQQHFDLVARLRTSRETEQRFRAILQQRTGKLSDVLEVEQEIARVRGDIETMEGEQKELEHRVSFATVALQLTEEYKAQLNPPAASISTRIYNAFVDGYHNASETLLGGVIFFAVNGPTILIWIAVLALPAIFVWRRYRRTLAAL